MLILSYEQREYSSLVHGPDKSAIKARRAFTETTAALLSTLETDRDPGARRLLLEALDSVLIAECRLNFRFPPTEERRAVRRVVLTSELIHQARLSLFPAERMLVGAARNSEGRAEVTALFDVTGAGHAAHVRADSEKLARALIAMDATDTYLLLWLHSHPGRGPGATTPSSIDRRQQEAWIRDYCPDLLSVILVEDGFVRLWGPAVEDNRIEIEIRGTGINETEERHVYKIEA